MAAIVVLALALLVGVTLVNRKGNNASPLAPDEANATVVRAIDGDTLVARIDGSEERVRLIGIDTPESVATDQPVECFGPEASKRLAELLPEGTPIRLERDVEPRDRYDRLLGYVLRVSDGLLVNRDQVANGYAEAKEYPPNTALAADLGAAQQAAQSSGAGMWSACAA